MCLLALVAAACGSDERDPGGKGSDVELVKAEAERVQTPDVTEKQVGELVRGNNEAAFEMYGAAGEAAGEEGNLIFSPYSISLAFSMAYAGARGETEAQIAETLGFLPQETQHPAFNDLDRRVSDPGGEVEGGGTPFRLNVANAVWGHWGYPFEEAYLGTLARHYGAGLQTLDFRQTESARREINGWVANETEGRIEDLVPPDTIDRDTRLALVNAIYFEASWWSKFEKAGTEDGPFTLPGGREVTVPMMRQAWKFPYAEGEGYQAVQLPYEGDAVDMIVILPEDGRLRQVEENLDADLLDEVRGKLPEAQVELTMPRFGFETDLKLIDLLEEMGLRLPFDPYEADLSGVTKEERLYIYEALHKATITVNEKGTVAAAATAILDIPVSGGGGPRTVTMDHPFIFSIVERETGTILFLGRVMNPR